MKGIVVAWLAAVSVIAVADPAPSAQKEAGKHFQRGVALYNETDYRAALVEFRRAYEIAPNAVVLYNIGETQYQLQNYAAALTTLERYLNESGDKASHRDEVEQTIETLRTRVGKVAVTTNVAGCEITVDDELVGKSPLASPVLVSIGRRKVTAMYPGRAPDTRFVEVATGDTVKLALALPDPEAAQAQPLQDAPKPPQKSSLPTIGWVATGVLGAGSIVMGVLAYHTSSQLKDEKATFPANGDDLNKKASRVTTYAAIADILGGAAIVTGGLTLAFTITRSRSHEVRVGVNPGGVVVGGTFK
jgi:tetratricopeptide (TPR) repeat protein